MDGGKMSPFNVIVADPPWQFGDRLGKRGAGANYPTMSLAQLLEMQTPVIAKNAWLFLWRVSSMQDQALELAFRWGFVIKSEIVWQKMTPAGKKHFGMGHYVRASHEACLIGVRGRIKPAVRNVRSTFEAPCPVGPNGRAIHSAKPDEFFDIVERLTGPGMSRLELFSRRNRPGWTCLGNETGKRGEAA